VSRTALLTERTVQLLCVDVNRFVEGVHPSIQRNPDLCGSCGLPKHCRISDRSGQNSSKLWHTVCNVFI